MYYLGLDFKKYISFRKTFVEQFVREINSLEKILDKIYIVKYIEALKLLITEYFYKN